MNSLGFSYNMNVSRAHIIMLPGNEVSERLATRCLASCISVSQQAEYYRAFDGTGDEIKTSATDSWLKWIKVTDRYLSRTEIACALSHISLWAKCVEQDQPLIILEHDAIMVQAYPIHKVFNSIAYLGAKEQKEGWAVMPTPPHASNGHEYHFICRAHAYSIDPAVAKNMLAHVIKYGIHESLDMMLRADIFPIHQPGFYAYDEPGETTITARKKTPDGSER